MVNFRVGAITYAVNGMAKGHGNPDVEAIWTTRPVSPPKVVVARLPEPKRRELFRAEVACPDQAERAAELKFPGASSLSELKTLAIYEGKMQTLCTQRVRAKDRLTDKEFDLIDAEGYGVSVHSV